MKLFVTGGTGFVGGHLLRRLIAGPHEVRCLARDPNALAWASEAGFDVRAGDVTDRAALAEAMAGCDASCTWRA